MKQTQFNPEFFTFLQQAATPFHATAALAEMFQANGFQLLLETEKWITKPGKHYYCIRDNGTILAFRISPTGTEDIPWRMTAAHTDSPALQLKPLPQNNNNGYSQLGIEVYGGPLLSTWFDRDLGIAGRVAVLEKNDTISMRLLDFKRPLITIPSLAIHLNRKANEELKINKQKHLYPIVALTGDGDISFQKSLMQQLGREHPQLLLEKILGFDLFCYDTQAPVLTGLNEEFIAAGRLDNLASCFVGAKALLQDETSDNCLLLCSNHEEIGSATVAGAQGTFLRSALEKILPQSFHNNQFTHSSILLSMDNAHAVHPNFPDKHDPHHLPLLNGGPVIKHNANQRYATTCRSAAIYKTIAEEVSVTPQEFVMKNDMACGSTIGPIAATDLGVQTIDIGIPSLAMHSIRELTGTNDPYLLYKTIAHFYNRPSLPKVHG